MTYFYKEQGKVPTDYLHTRAVKPRSTIQLNNRNKVRNKRPYLRLDLEGGRQVGGYEIRVQTQDFPEPPNLSSRPSQQWENLWESVPGRPALEKFTTLKVSAESDVDEEGGQRPKTLRTI